MRIWHAATGAAVWSPLTVDAGEYGVLSVSFSPKDNLIAAGCYNGKIHLVDAVAGEVKSLLTGDKQVNCVAFSPDGNTLAAGDGGYKQVGNVRLYDVHTGEVKSTFRGDPTAAPVAASQIRTVLSLAPLAIFLPSGLKQTLMTSPSCPLNVDFTWPVWTS